MIFVVLYKYLNCAADKTDDTGYTANTNCNSNDILTLEIFFISFCCKQAFESRPI